MTTPAPTLIEQLLTVADVCQLLQLKRTFVYDAVHKGHMPHVWLGSRLRFEPDQIREWVKQNRNNAPKATVLPISGVRR
jgi:excisionase family DNA binding protein